MVYIWRGRHKNTTTNMNYWPKGRQTMKEKEWVNEWEMTNLSFRMYRFHVAYPLIRHGKTKYLLDTTFAYELWVTGQRWKTFVPLHFTNRHVQLFTFTQFNTTFFASVHSMKYKQTKSKERTNEKCKFFDLNVSTENEYKTIIFAKKKNYQVQATRAKKPTTTNQNNLCNDSAYTHMHAIVQLHTAPGKIYHSLLH